MHYVYWVIPGLLAGRPGPNEFDWDLPELRQAGLGAILSLNAGGINPAAFTRQGFAHLLLPLPCSVPPTPEDIALYQRQLPLALDFIDRHVRQGVPTLVHCHAGRDRTGVVLACYLSTARGIPPAEAVARLRAVKPSALMAAGYEALVHTYVASASPAAETPAA